MARDGYLRDPSETFLNQSGLVRFTATVPVTVVENKRMAGAQRIQKGRFRSAHEQPLPTDSYSVFASVKDAALRLVRVTARTPNYVEVKVVDGAGAAADAEEVTIEIKRVVGSDE